MSNFVLCLVILISYMTFAEQFKTFVRTKTYYTGIWSKIPIEGSEDATKEATLEYNNIQSLSKAFLESTTHNIYSLPSVSNYYLSGLKSHCLAFYHANYGMTIAENVTTLQQSVEHNYQIKCLPYFFLAGFTKCGTTDLSSKMRLHQSILGGNSGDTAIKEAHFWDDHRLTYTKTIRQYLRIYDKSTEAVLESIENKTTDYNHQAVIGDFTPRYIWHGDVYHEEFHNKNQDTPQILIPHKIKKFLPNSKIIVIMRNPTTRLQSDYNHFVALKQHDIKSQEELYHMISQAIKWWQKCISLLPDRRCAYGHNYTKPLELLDFGKCIMSKTRPCCQADIGNVWFKNVADRLRIGIYYLYINDYLQIFSKDQMLFLKFEDYISNPLDTLEEKVFPFLELPPLDRKIREILVNKLQAANKNGRTKREGYVVFGDKIRTLLDNFYMPHNLKLTELLGDENFNWENQR